jgi:hypothetical protein
MPPEHEEAGDGGVVDAREFRPVEVCEACDWSGERSWLDAEDCVCEEEGEDEDNERSRCERLERSSSFVCKCERDEAEEALEAPDAESDELGYVMLLEP